MTEAKVKQRFAGGEMPHPPLSAREEAIASAIVDAAYRVHKTLGPGLVERI